MYNNFSLSFIFKLRKNSIQGCKSWQAQLQDLLKVGRIKPFEKFFKRIVTVSCRKNPSQYVQSPQAFFMSGTSPISLASEQEEFHNLTKSLVHTYLLKKAMIVQVELTNNFHKVPLIFWSACLIFTIF